MSNFFSNMFLCTYLDKFGALAGEDQHPFQAGEERDQYFLSKVISFKQLFFLKKNTHFYITGWKIIEGDGGGDGTLVTWYNKAEEDVYYK